MSKETFQGKTKEEILEKVYQLGLEYEQEKHSCSQCVVAALQEIFQIKDDNLFRASYALAGGIGGSTNGSCGALSGGTMMISYFYGRSRSEFDQLIFKKKSEMLAKKLQDRFQKEYGSCICQAIQQEIFGRSFDFWDEEEHQAFEEAGGHEDKCPVVVAKAAVWTAEIIWEEQHKSK